MAGCINFKPGMGIREAVQDDCYEIVLNGFIQKIVKTHLQKKGLKKSVKGKV